MFKKRLDRMDLIELTKAKDVEMFILSDFTVKEKRESKIKKAYLHYITTGFQCPRCENMNKATNCHDESGRCKGCGLEWYIAGNGLFCRASKVTP